VTAAEAGRKPPPDERLVWRRWLYGGVAVLVVVLLVSALLPRSPVSPRGAGIPDLPEGVAMDRPLLEDDLTGDRSAWLALMALEDARAPEPGDAERMAAFLSHDAPGVRRAAARGLGRLERPELVRALAPSLEDAEPRVRIEAANAVAQAVHRGEGVAEAAALLERRLDAEADAGVQGALARALGRLRVAGGAPELDARAGRIAAVAALPSDDPGGTHHHERLLGAARGAFFLFRNPAARGWEGEARRVLEATVQSISGDAGLPDPVRRAAAAARVAAGSPPEGWVAELLEAADPELRRTAALAATSEESVRRALDDPDATVRLEGVRAWARHRVEAGGIGPLLEAVEDPSDHVALGALGALGAAASGASGAPGAPGAPHASGAPGAAPSDIVDVLDTLAGTLGGAAAGQWHRPVHALLALARHDAGRAAAHLETATTHPDPFVRAHGARVAGILGDEGALRALAEDPSANVREAAITALVPLAGRGADPVLVAQLAEGDPQLVQSAARLLAGSPAREETMAALLASLERFTAEGRSTDRDPRVALIQRIGGLGDARDAGRLERWTRDPDPAVGAAAAAVIGNWTGQAPEPVSTGLPSLPLPGWNELAELQGGRLVLTLDEGGLEAPERVVIRMLPFAAPTNAARVVRMARAGTFDGLTLHRVAPNFVVQGGSPGANEYAGHGHYTRDELGRIGHWAGTVGVSTRGRDTGDGQLFVNLVDNLRLDHDYTVFGVVVEGMDVVARVQEGVVIREARWEPPAGGDPE
jgi:cyclophilin family peptidyl-prolyl cis-trans isomerase/HEAT repeat protein